MSSIRVDAMPRTRQRSVRKSIVGLIILCILLAGAMLAAVLYLDRRQERLHNTFVERTIAVGEIPIVLDAMELTLNEYMRTWSGVQFARYTELSRRLRAAAAEAAELCHGAQSSLDHLRRIDAFNDYQSDILASERSSPIAGYAPLSFVRMALDRHKIHAQELAHSDLVQNRTAYMRELRRLRSIRLGLWAFFLLPLSAAGLFAYRGVRNHIRRLEEHARLERQLAVERLENERKERMLVEARASALKAQINPHFLFNTLNLIGKSSFLQEPELAMELVEATAKILRYSLDSGNRKATIQEEMDIVSTYLYLQKHRFGSAVSYTVEVEETLWNHPVQPMILQPLVENCFKHGMDGRRELAIRIAARRVGDMIEISVRDNGQGFPARPDGPGGNRGIGLDNIRDRLRLEYGMGEPVRIDSVPGAYAEVTLTIPAGRGGRAP